MDSYGEIKKGYTFYIFLFTSVNMNYSDDAKCDQKSFVKFVL